MRALASQLAPTSVLLLDQAVRRSMPLVGAVAGMSILGALFSTLEYRGPETRRRPTRTDVRMERSSSVVPQVRPQQPASLHSAINDAGRDPLSFRPAPSAV